MPAAIVWPPVRSMNLGRSSTPGLLKNDASETNESSCVHLPSSLLFLYSSMGMGLATVTSTTALQLPVSTLGFDFTTSPLVLCSRDTSFPGGRVLCSYALTIQLMPVGNTNSVSLTLK